MNQILKYSSISVFLTTRKKCIFLVYALVSAIIYLCLVNEFKIGKI